MDISLLSKKELSLISDCFLFSGIEREYVYNILSKERCTLEAFSRGEIVFSPENYSRSVCFVLSGRIEVTRPGDTEHKYIISTLSPSSLFGVSALWSNETDFQTVLTCCTSCRLIMLSQELLRTSMAENFLIAENYIRFLTGRIRFLNERIRSLSSASAEAALAAHLLESTADGSSSVTSGSMTSLAKGLNIGRASLYRALDTLSERRLIERCGRNIVILDRKGLADIN